MQPERIPEEKLKVLHVIPSYIPAYRYGGPVKAVHGLCASLARHGADVTVFTTNIDQDRDLDVPLERPVGMDGVKVYYYPVEFPRSYCYSGRLGSALKERVPEFDIVHIHSVYLYSTAAACRWCRCYGKPYILNPFGALDPAMIKLKSSFRKRLYIKLVERRAIGGAKAIHAASLYEKSNYEMLGFKTPAVVIPRGIDLAEYPDRAQSQYLVKRYPELLGKKIILFLGRVHPKKGLNILAGAFKKIVNTRDDAFLVIAGSGDERYTSEIKGLFRKDGLGGRVIFTGMLLDSDKVSALRESDLFVLPSYGENFGIAVLEAMACGLPVVITDRVGLHPDVAEYKAGLVTGYEADEIAGGILKLLDDKNLKNLMGANGRRLAKDRFSIDRVAGETMKIYQKMLG